MEHIGGIDEVGRGPLAGPVVAACVIITRPFPELAHVKDSKALTAKKREMLSRAIRANTHWALGAASTHVIDEVNILQATFAAMRLAVSRMPVKPDRLLVDGKLLPPHLPCPAQAIIGGDALEPAIACASILAKVARDRLMEKLASRYPAYGWGKNAGYGTAAHLAAIAEFGATPHHRFSFAPLKTAV